MQSLSDACPKLQGFTLRTSEQRLLNSPLHSKQISLSSCKIFIPYRIKTCRRSQTHHANGAASGKQASLPWVRADFPKKGRHKQPADSSPTNTSMSLYATSRNSSTLHGSLINSSLQISLVKLNPE